MTKFQKLVFATLLCFIATQCLAQEKPQPPKELNAKRTNKKIKIDGVLNDSAWLTATQATNFVEWRPSFGKQEEEASKTEVYILYDNDAIYVAGFCHENSEDSIAKELVGRDVVGVNDFIGIIFDTYSDKINGFGYYVTPLGEQFDAKYSSTGEDPSWSSVYETAAKIVGKGWTFEMKIPYAAIRFASKPTQNWGLNITRRRSKSGKQVMWNPVNPVVGGSFLAQFGVLKELNNIKPPMRLAFYPYLSFNANHYPYNNPNQKNLTTTLNGGMDVKYGINQAFTLDMTLVPDFGQVQSDNQILNLGPFEVKYNEYRTFFTEGTELFGKGELFYSRRIGGEPVNFSDAYTGLSASDSIVKNPIETKLINATKISGRNKKGLGIGFFNAITATQHATILNKTSGVTREVETSPLTNYNIIVLDQTLKNSSSVSFINTSVIHAGATYDANVSAALWDIYDKKNKWNFDGKFAISNLLGYEAIGKNTSGTSHSFGFSKVNGRFNFRFWQDYANENYQQNDMGYFTNNNYLDNGIWMGYKWLKPKKWYNSLNLNLNIYHSYRAKPWDYQTTRANINLNAQLKSLWFVGSNVYYNAGGNDFYEPRVNGYVFKRPYSFGGGFWVNTNEAKKFSANLGMFIANRPQIKGFGFETNLYYQYRFNKKLTLSISNYLDVTNNGKGFAMYDYTINAPIIGLRQRVTSENVFSVKYNFTNKMGLTFRARHYWSTVKNESTVRLYADGSETPYTPINIADANYNFNIFNVDMTYTWQFALGSFITINWKDASYNDDQQKGYFKNLNNTLSAPQNNSFSVKVIYFLDYNSLKIKPA